jgi:bifunctional UDP-N-acetylglucosamine pyrophosphorylase/glucosamine-1-phosphate N-acetyltransferase
MIAVILAAGRGTRMGALTNDTPKPMLSVHGKNLIERKLEVLPKEITKVIIVVGYLKESIISYFGDSWNGIAIQYIEQTVLSGTGGAIDLCKEQLQDEEQFMVLMGDDLYSQEDLQDIISSKYSILVANQGVEGRKKGWQVFFDDENMLTEIHQEVEAETSPYINAGAYSLGKEYFTEELYKMDNGEYSLPHTLVNLITRKKSEGVPLQVRVVVAKSWIQITSPESIVEAEKVLNN